MGKLDVSARCWALGQALSEIIYDGSFLEDEFDYGKEDELEEDEEEK